ncbi:UNVERIFIED_CONTAM: hypothetical protein Slati_0225400 [Sesamum latifolium]|uniref:Uncharacterized protein n=1 Tax=Sesamum latifolium TaxID=2727402 RepID=A0AAW2YC07_9LAMI
MCGRSSNVRTGSIRGVLLRGVARTRETTVWNRVDAARASNTRRAERQDAARQARQTTVGAHAQHSVVHAVPDRCAQDSTNSCGRAHNNRQMHAASDRRVQDLQQHARLANEGGYTLVVSRQFLTVVGGGLHHNRRPLGTDYAVRIF